MKRPPILVTLIVALLAITLPYGLAVLLNGPEHVFIGFLLNPTDGASYLAKMYQGWSGAWQFTLPFTAEAGSGSYLFLYYLFLGHLARWLSLPLILVFHLARLMGACFLLLALVQFFDLIFKDRPDLYRLAFWLSVLGSGMGWLVVLLGELPSDFWVAEAYPFLAMFANPHFPLGLALLIGSASLLIKEQAAFRSVRLVLYGLLISVILPFGVVVMLMIAGSWCVWCWVDTRRLNWQPVVALGLLGGPFLLYQYWVAQTDPLLAVWNAQNLTPSPPVWDFVLSFSPGLLLAPFGVYHLLKNKTDPSRRILIPWFLLGLVLIYFPFSLQRRFMLGFYIPTILLAVFGMDFLRQSYAARTRWLRPALISLSYPSNFLLILIGLFGATAHSPLLYMTRDEAAALAWVQQSTAQNALLLASPEMGSLIPALTGRRVVYGHPFETLYAAQKEQRVKSFFAGTGKPDLKQSLLTDPTVNYLVYGPREQQLGGKLDFSTLSLRFESGAVRIYSLNRGP